MKDSDIEKLSDPTIINRMITGIHVGRGVLPLFRKRPAKLVNAIELSLIWLIPATLILVGTAVCYWLGYLDVPVSRLYRLFAFFVGISIVVIMLAYGSISHEMGGSSSETD